MNEQISAQAFAIVGKAAPAEEAGGIEGTLRRWPQKGFPVDRCFRSIWWNRVFPSASGRVAIGIAFNRIYLPKPSRVVDLFALGEEDRTHPLGAGLHDALVPMRRINDREAFLNLMSQGLFTINVLSGGTRIFHDPAMLMVRGGNQDRIHILPVQDRAIVARNRDIFLQVLSRRLLSAVIKIADRDALHSGNG